MVTESVLRRAAAADSPSALAEVLRWLRRREARDRPGPVLGYRDIAKATGWSLGSVCGYFAGTALAPADRFDELVRLLAARPDELGALATARDRVADARRVSHVPPVARTLPAAVRSFTGRTVQLAWLDALLSADTGSAPVVISAIAGMGGVGKTALAVHWAYRVAGQFPGGALYVNLRGYDPIEPMTTWDALGILLVGLNVSPQAMPADVAGRTALYQRILAGRRALVLLDNGRDVEQVRPLLPPVPCLAVVTSRDALADLVADGARRLTLDALPESEAVALVRLLLGPRADREPAAVLDLAQRCGRLPLALRVAAEQADLRRLATVADLTAEFDDGLAASPDVTGDERMSLQAVFSWSLRHLPDEVARAFWLLGLLPLTGIDRFGFAALAGIDAEAADRLGQALERAHLLWHDEAGRWSMHDLLRDYATDSVERELVAGERGGAVRRLLDYYLATAAAAVRTAFPHSRFTEAHIRPVPEWPAAAPDLSDVASAIAWLGTERTNLVRVSMHAAAHGWPAHAVAFALTLRPFLDGGYDRDGLSVLTAALTAADAVGPSADQRERAAVLIGLATTRWRLGEVDVAVELAETAFEEFTRLGSPLGASRALHVLGMIRDWQGRFDEAVDCFERALHVARSAGLRAVEGRILTVQGLAYGRRERYEAANEYCRQAAEVTEEVGDALGLAEARATRSYALAELGHYDLAATMAEEALVFQLEHGRPTQRAMAMITYGLILTKMARYADAVEMLAGALEIGRSLESLQVVSQVLIALGETHRHAGDTDRAIACHTEAVEVAGRSGDRLDVAWALEGLADSYAAAGETGRAREYWARAHEAFVEIGHVSAERIAALLAD
jgi:tetratricopeptide (TPR) repeat protein